MQQGTRGVCRHCEGSLVWVRPFIKADESSTWEPYIDDPRWFHMHPDEKAQNAERNIITDKKYGMLGFGCPVKEGTLPGRVGEPREFCTELKGDWPRVVCNKPVVDPDVMMCGVHIKRYQEDREKEEKSRLDRDLRNAYAEGLREVCERLRRNYGLKVREGYVSYNYSATAELNPFELEELLISITGPEGLKTPEQEVA